MLLTVRLFLALTRIGRFDLLLVQNPPALPTLYVAWLAAKLGRSRLIIDWHNLGFTVLGLRLGRRHFAVRLARWFEKRAGHLADGHLCVSRGFARFLTDRFGLMNVRVLYDRPAAPFHRRRMSPGRGWRSSGKRMGPRPLASRHG